MNILRKDTFKKTTWSGGTTTELIIAPENADYSKRKFDFRVSSATVELTESDFTLLPGVKRHLMILEGEMKLVHKGQYEKQLGAFEQDTFMGDFRTRSISAGPVIDFNLMLQGTLEGRLIHHPCDGTTVIRWDKVNETIDARDVYCAKGRLELTVGNHSIILFEGDYLQLQQFEQLKDLEIKGVGHLVEVNVWSV